MCLGYRHMDGLMQDCSNSTAVLYWVIDIAAYQVSMDHCQNCIIGTPISYVQLILSGQYDTTWFTFDEKHW